MDWDAVVAVVPNLVRPPTAYDSVSRMGSISICCSRAANQGLLQQGRTVCHLIAVRTICLAQPRHNSWPHMLATKTSSLC